MAANLCAEVVVIGAGILGLSVASHLAERGAGRIIVVDLIGPSAGATGRSGALVRSSFDDRLQSALGLYSIGVFRNWPTRIGGSCGFAQVGHLYAASPAEVTDFETKVAAQKRWGIGIGLIDRTDVGALCPSFRWDESVGAVAYEEEAGCCDANLASRALYDACRSRGVSFVFGDAVTGITTDRSRVSAIETSTTTICTGTVVVAAGAWTNRVLFPLGLDFGLRTRLSRVCVLRPPEFATSERLPTVIDHTQGAWFRPIYDGAILVGAERTGIDDVDPDTFPELGPSSLISVYRQILARRYAVAPYAAPRGFWSGVYMASPDHRPLVGPVSGIDGLYLATGDSGTSFKIAPAIGLGLAETILDGVSSSFDLASFCPDRFDRRLNRPEDRTVYVAPISETRA